MVGDNNKEQSRFSVMPTSGWSEVAAQKKKAEQDTIRPHESKLVEVVKKRNAEARKLIKQIGLFALLPIWILSILIKSSTYHLLLNLIFWLSFVAGTLLWFRYEHYRKAGIQICKNCLEKFVPKENDLDKLCPYCGSGNSAANL